MVTFTHVGTFEGDSKMVKMDIKQIGFSSG